MTSDDRINLVVLFGGQSAEHDVSCATAAHVVRAADPEKYRITAVGIGRDGSWALTAVPPAAVAAGANSLSRRLDPAGSAVAPTEAIGIGTPGTTVVLPLLHGPLGEDGTVQGLLELAGVPYVGSGVLGSALCMDKAMAKQLAGAAGIAQPRYVALREHDLTPGLPAMLADHLGLPLFVKPANMGSSIGVSKARSFEDVRDAIALALRYDEWVVAEEAIVGREIEVAVLGNVDPRASVAGEIVHSANAEFYDFEDKYVDDGAQALAPAALSSSQSEEVRDLAVQAFQALRCDGLARVDFFLEDRRGFLLNEVNTMPGFTPISMFPKLWLASGLSYADLIDELVRLALDRHSRQRRNVDR